MGSITAPERMCAPTSEPFSSTIDGELAPGAGSELLEANGGGEPGGAGADDHHVALHRLARLCLGSVECHRLFPRADWSAGSIGRRAAQRQARTGKGAARALDCGACPDNAKSAAAAALLAWYRDMGVDDAGGRGAVDWLSRGDAAPGHAFRLAECDRASRLPRRGAAPRQPVARASRRPPATPRRPRQFPTAAPDAAVMAARTRGRAGRHAGRAARRRSAAFDGCGLEGHRQEPLLLPRRGAGAADADRRGARTRRGPAGQAVRRPRRTAARQDAGRHRPRRAGRPHHQHRLLASAGKPHADPAGGAGLPPLPGAAGGAGRRPSWCCCWAARRPSTSSTSRRASCACAASGAR